MDNVKEATEQAYATIVTELAAPHFFEKLAAHGVSPRSESEAAEMWELASKLHVLYAAEQEKAAAAQTATLAAHNAQLDELLAAAGLGAPAEKSAAFGNEAAVAAERPEIAEAILKLQHGIASALQDAQ